MPYPALLSLLANLTAVPLTAWCLALFIWGVATLYLPLPNTLIPVAEFEAKHTTPVSIATIQRANLFGKEAVEAKAVTRREEPRRIAPSRLNAQLMGVITGDGTREAAILLVQGQQRTYLTGEQFEINRQSYTLVDVEPDYVVVEQGGVETKISMKERKDAQASLITNYSSPQAQTETQHTLPTEYVDLNTPEIRNLVGDVRANIHSNPLSLMRFLNLTPVNNDGLTGFRISPGGDARLFNQLPLQRGDLLTALNGQPVSALSPTSFGEIMRDSNQVELTISRNGQPMSITLSF